MPVNERSIAQPSSTYIDLIDAEELFDRAMQLAASLDTATVSASAVSSIVGLEASTGFAPKPAQSKSERSKSTSPAPARPATPATPAQPATHSTPAQPSTPAASAAQSPVASAAQSPLAPAAVTPVLAPVAPAAVTPVLAPVMAVSSGRPSDNPEVDNPGAVRSSRSSFARRGWLAVAFGLVALLIGIIYMRPRPAVVANPATGALVADELVAKLVETKGVLTADSAYLPDIGPVVHVSAENVLRGSVKEWWASVVTPMAPKFRGASPKDRLFVMVRVIGSENYARLLVVPLNSIDVPSSYQIMPAEAQGHSTAP